MVNAVFYSRNNGKMKCLKLKFDLESIPLEEVLIFLEIGRPI